MSAEFKLRVRQVKGLRKTRRSIISQRRNRKRPVIRSRDWDQLTQSVSALSNQGFTGGVGGMLGPSGSQLRSTPVVAGVQTKFAVVRDLGETGDDHFILVQIVNRTKTNPWDGEWEIDLQKSAEKINTFPGTKSRHYLRFVWLADTFETSTPVVTVMKINGIWIAIQTDKFMPSQNLNTAKFRISDCKPIESL